uniref:Angiotensin-converting enzyme n=1 Tax=Hemiscolopendra marginata TaxID=943146 RepID=A0A646QF91_9MYRI
MKQLLILFLLRTIVDIQSVNGNVEKYPQGNNTDEAAAKAFLAAYNVESPEKKREITEAEWKYTSNLTEENKNILLKTKLDYTKYELEAWKNTTSFAWKNFSDESVKRQFKFLSILGSAALPEEKLTKLQKLGVELESMYGQAKICEYIKPNVSSNNENRTCNLSLEPDLTRILANSEDYDELLHVWVEWRNASGKKMRQKYLEFVDLENESSRLNGFKDTSEYWLSGYEDDDIQKEFEKLWDQVRPLYQQLHAYVRRKLIGKYGADKIKADGPIPAHILGNMWAQSWEKLFNLTVPFPNKRTMDVSEKMVEQNYTALKMFQMAEKFFTSLGLEPMTEDFWNKSIIEKPKDREIVCHASAWDFWNGKDVRIKQCTDITMTFLEVTHHEMGHIQYYLLYKDQPITFRQGANPGFHEAVGDLMAISVATTKHMMEVGLMDSAPEDKETDINFLLHRALYKVAFLPFGYLMDKWRWGVFQGEIKSDELNKKWWEHRLKYQGVVPPVPRTEEDFDAGGKYHIPANVEYSRYYIAAILQFQFHKTLCELAGHVGPLHRCDIYKSKAAGDRLRDALKLGISKPWPEVLSIMTGGKTNRMDAAPLVEYFQPLYDWLKEINQNETIGWKEESNHNR